MIGQALWPAIGRDAIALACPSARTGIADRLAEHIGQPLVDPGVGERTPTSHERLCSSRHGRDAMPPGFTAGAIRRRSVDSGPVVDNLPINDLLRYAPPSR